ncbi:VanW family protein [Bacillus marinisedimentorum]|uniref:VanW family protein n=1 Tax=Bacillus marinisedimentorum TaxID=1821260 RepID=UPI000872318B|nr:VanW family protein [Bacillus marinisedimentorum]
MKNIQQLKLFLLLFLGSLFIIAFTHGGTFVYEKTVSANGTYSSGTKIADADISGLTEEEATSELADIAAEWQQGAAFQLKMQDKTYPINGVMIDVETSIAAVQDGQNNKPVITVNDEEVYRSARLLAGETILSVLDIDRLKQNMLQDAEKMKTGVHTYSLLAFRDVDGAEKQVVARVSITGLADKMPILHDYVKPGETYTILPESSFSVLNTFGKKGVPGEQGLYLSIISSALYRAAAETNFSIVERHIGNAVPEDIPPGYEAKVLAGNLDFVFYNPNPTPYTITFDLTEDILTVEISGIPFFLQYEAVLGEKASYNPKTVVQYSSLLAPGEKKVTEEGSPGYSVQLFRIEKTPAGELLSEMVLAEDYYSPVHRIEVRPLREGSAARSGSAPPETEETASDLEPGGISDDPEPGNETEAENGQTGPADWPDRNGGSIWDQPGEVIKGN